jgi:hypothetical protein
MISHLDFEGEAGTWGREFKFGFRKDECPKIRLSGHKDLGKVMRSVRRDRHADTRFGPAPVEDVFPVTGRTHPVLASHFDGLSKAAVKSDILAERIPAPDAERSGARVERRTVSSLVAEEFVPCHISRMKTGDARHILIPPERGQPLQSALLIDNVKSTALECVIC